MSITVHFSFNYENNFLLYYNKRTIRLYMTTFGLCLVLI